MFRDEFKERYTTIPFAVYREDCDREPKQLIAHQHAEAELISVTEGRADFYVDTRHYVLEAGDLLVIPPYSIHRARIDGDGRVRYNCICFDLDLLWDKEVRAGFNQSRLSVAELVHASDDCAGEMQNLIELGCRACEGGEDGWELEAIGCVSMLFGALKKRGCFSSGQETRGELEFAQRAMDYISEHHGSSVTSTSAATALYMNKSYFCRRFKRVFGSCFSDYLLAYRLEKAKLYLRATEERVTEISFRVGFNSCSYFSKAFRERFGISPLTYRRERG